MDLYGDILYEASFEEEYDNINDFEFDEFSESFELIEEEEEYGAFDVELTEEYYMESDDGGPIARAIAAISEFFAKLWSKFVDFITRKQLKSKLESARNIVKKTGDGNKKVKVPDVLKFNKLADTTLDALEKAKNGDQVDAIMDRYQKERTKLKLEAAAIVMTVSAAITLAIVGIRKHKKTLDGDKKKTISIITKVKNLFGKKDGTTTGTRRTKSKYYDDPDKFDKAIDKYSNSKRYTYSSGAGAGLGDTTKEVFRNNKTGAYVEIINGKKRAATEVSKDKSNIMTSFIANIGGIAGKITKPFKAMGGKLASFGKKKDNDGDGEKPSTGGRKASGKPDADVEDEVDVDDAE